MYIVQLDYGVWLASWSGDPGRTLLESNARKYKTKKGARIAMARVHTLFGRFLNAKILEVDGDLSSGGDG